MPVSGLFLIVAVIAGVGALACCSAPGDGARNGWRRGACGERKWIGGGGRRRNDVPPTSRSREPFQEKVT